MQVKALDEIEDYHDQAAADPNTGEIRVSRVETVLKAGEVYDLPDDQAKRLIELGHASDDLAAPTKAEVEVLRLAEAGDLHADEVAHRLGKDHPAVAAAHKAAAGA